MTGCLTWEPIARAQLGLELPRPVDWLKNCSVDSHEVVRSCFDHAPPKALAENIGVSTSLLYKWSEPKGGTQSGATNPLDRAQQINAASGDNRVVKWLCAQAGGFFIENAAADPETGYDVAPATNEIVQQFASLLSEIALAAKDERITTQEAEAIRLQWDELKSYCEGFVIACERGDFNAIELKRDSLRIVQSA